MMQQLIKNIIVLIILLLTILAIPSIFAKSSAKNNLPIIIDTDAGLDDSIAILYLLNQKQQQIRAIIVDGNGMVHLKFGLANMQYLISKSDSNNIELAAGAKKSLYYHHHFPKWVRTAADNLFMQSSQNLLNRYLSASQLLQALLLKQHQIYIIIALGPLTNIAKFIKSHPNAKRFIQRIYIMGGAIDVPGNVSSVLPKTNNKVAEWNFYIDPLAAKIVLQSGIPITLIPLDVTNKLPLTENFVARLSAIQNKQITLDFLIQALRHNSTSIKQGVYDFWDPLTAVVALNHDIYSAKSLPLTVYVKPEAISGKVVIEKDANKITVVDQVNAKLFKDILISGL